MFRLIQLQQTDIYALQVNILAFVANILQANGGHE